MGLVKVTYVAPTGLYKRKLDGIKVLVFIGILNVMTIFVLTGTLIL